MNFGDNFYRAQITIAKRAEEIGNEFANEQALLVANARAEAAENVLKYIADKDPQQVSRSEAADMACEFHNKVTDAFKAWGKTL